MIIVFYDINLKNLQKYISDIVDLIILNDDVNVVLLYDEFNQDGYNYYKDKKCRIIKNSSITYHSIERKLEYLKPDIFMVNAQRLSDSAFVVVAKKMGIKTGMIQHGMYIPFMKRERFFLIKKAFKTLKYFMYSQVIAKAINRRRMEVFKKFLEAFVKGRIYKDAIDFYTNVNVDFVLVYGDYWKEYHRDIFGYSLEQQEVIGYHELNKVDDIMNKPFEKDSICYIAQTLVEDGRIDRNIMKKFFDGLDEIGKNKKVYIKLHPRTDKTIFKHNKFILLENTIPNCELYLGHYSSLLALVASLQGQTILFELDEHVIPKYFKEFSITVNSFTELSKLLDDDNICNVSNTIERYFSKEYNTENVVSLIYQKVKNRP